MPERVPMFADLTSDGVRQAVADQALVLVPVAQVEEHGPHLPIATDLVIATTVAESAALRLLATIPVLVTPPLWAGYSVARMKRWPGTFCLRPFTMISLLEDVLGSLIEMGFRKVAFVNGHGLNVGPLETAVRSVGDKYDVYPAGVSVWNMLGSEGAKVRESGPGGCGGHADELETSLLLHLRPELVDMSKATAVDAVQYHSRFYSGDLFLPALKTTWSTWDVHASQTGVHGDPTSATAEKGRRFFEIIVQNCCDFFLEFYQHPGAA